jgi:pimeloyl-ACP methyl ester carboxylesterase
MRTQSGLTYEVFGSGGRPIVACNCWCEAAPVIRGLDSHWLRRLAQDQTLIVTNRRGLAGSAGHSDLENEILGLKEVVEEFGSPATILGGCEASAAPIAMAAKHPSHVRALIVVNGSPRMARDGEYPGSSEKFFHRMIERVEEDWEAYFRTFFSEVAPMPWTDLDSAFSVLSEIVTADGLVAFLETFLSADVRGELSNIAVPTLLLHSSENEAIPMSQAEFLTANVTGARLLALQGARHHIDPAYNDQIAETVEQFLAGLN